MESQAIKDTGEIVVNLAGLLKDPYLIIIFIILCFFMLLIWMEKKDKRFLLENTLDSFADQVEALADEVKVNGEALMELTILLKTLSLPKGKGVADVEKLTSKTSDRSKGKGSVES